MVRHIVMWKLKEENRLENAREICRRLDALKGEIPELLSCETGVNVGTDNGCYDAVLVATFADFEALECYKKHPKHVAVSEFVHTVRTDRKVVDFRTGE